MSVFSVHTVVHRDGQAVQFAPGDELPDWADGKVGAHCLVPEDSKPANDGPELDPEPAAPSETGTAAPDFTSAAPRRGRPRK